MATNALNHNINTLARGEKEEEGQEKKKSCSERKGVYSSPGFFQTLKYVRNLRAPLSNEYTMIQTEMKQK